MTFSGWVGWLFGLRVGMGEEPEDGAFSEAVVHQCPHRQAVWFSV